MNYVWLALLVVAIVTAVFTGNVESVTKSAFESASTAVNIAISLIGIMTLWLGVMKIAEEAGFIKMLARVLKPVARKLFPDVPDEHPALGAIFLNISANWLGLGNAATPFGIKAMEELQTLNEDKDTATDSMIMFLALNTASITLIPMTIIAVRAGLKSQAPEQIIGTTIFASLMATITAVIAVKTFVFFSRKEKTGNKLIKNLLILSAFLIFIVLAVKFDFFAAFRSFIPFKSVILFISKWMIPVILLLIPLLAFIKKVKVYEVFVEGAKEGFQVAVRIIPFLVAILVAIGMFRASGAMAVFVKALTSLTNLLGMPAEVLPAALMRPLSGSGTLGIITELLETHGPDSFIGQLASTIYGCTETTFYVIAVYFGAVQIKKTRFAIPAGLIADAAGILAAIFICRLLFL